LTVPLRHASSSLPELDCRGSAHALAASSDACLHLHTESSPMLAPPRAARAAPPRRRIRFVRYYSVVREPWDGCPPRDFWTGVARWRSVGLSVPQNWIVCLSDVGLTPRFVPKHVLRKEVIQPQVPLRLPCYDFTPVTNHSLGACLPCGLAQPLLEQSTPMV
jgi:hypothetical protein